MQKVYDSGTTSKSKLDARMTLLKDQSKVISAAWKGHEKTCLATLELSTEEGAPKFREKIMEVVKAVSDQHLHGKTFDISSCR